MTDWALSRRKLLQGLGLGAGCLPLLQATRSYGQAAKFPKKLIVHLQTEGYRIPAWLPKDGPLANQTLPDSSSPLEPYKDLLIFLGNLGNNHSANMFWVIGGIGVVKLAVTALLFWRLRSHARK